MRTTPSIPTNPETLRANGAKKARRNRIIMATTTLVAGAAATLVLAKKGKLNPIEGGNKTVEAIKAALKKPADKVLNIIAGSKVIASVTEKIGAAQAKVAPHIKSVSTKANNIKEGIIADSEVFAENAKTTFRNAKKTAGVYSQEARCKLSGLAGEAREASKKAGETFKDFAEKDSTKKAVDFVKDIPSKVSKLANQAKERVANLIDKIIKKKVAG